MSMEFGGTLNRSQLDRFAAFARAQVPSIGARLNHLASEQQRIGVLTFSFDANGIPVAYTVDPPTSYLAKLLAIYEILGGDPFFDLTVRNRSQAIFLRRTDETVPAQLMSNGEIQPLPGLGDGPSAAFMATARGWMTEILEYRRERLEHQIRRLVDYQEQLQREQDALARVAAGSDVENSLENALTEIQALIDDPTYRAAYDDKGQDPHGKLTSAPHLPYSGGPDRAPSEVYGKDSGSTGVTKPGQVAPT